METCSVRAQFSPAGRWSGYFEKVGKRVEFAARVPLHVRRISDTSSPTVFANNTRAYSTRCPEHAADVLCISGKFLVRTEIKSRSPGDRERISHLLLTLSLQKAYMYVRSHTEYVGKAYSECR